MSSLPLSLKAVGLIERHQVEGMDPSDRSFSRAILVNRTAQGYTGRVMYESLTVEGQAAPTVGTAVARVVAKLREFGFRQMRTRVNFKGKQYLAEKETWVDYPD